MNNILKGAWLIAAGLLLSFLSSCQPDEEVIVEQPVVTAPPRVASPNNLVDDWIYEVMGSYYYWNDGVVSPDSAGQDPEDYFYSQVNSEDRFSYITDDYSGLMSELNGVYSSMGYSPAFSLLPGLNDVFIAIEFVYSDSPAERAGLHRGDLILSIDGQTLNRDNYYDLFSQSQYTATLGSYDEADGIQPTGQTVTLSAEVIATDPVLYHEVKEFPGKKIGYLVYTEFISGERDEWLNRLGAVLDEFIQAGVSELVVDLRYNLGGEINTARYLASALAPASVVSSQDVLVRFNYNSDLEASIEAEEGRNSESLVSTFVDNGHQLNLGRVFFLTGTGTASASELLINGLKPYMPVMMIGEPTVGKYYGSWVIPDTEPPARHNYAVMPLVLKYANADGETDFKDGLSPQYYVEGNLLEAKPFGDESDPLLAQALSLIAGNIVNARTLSSVFKSYQELENPVKMSKSRLLVAPSEMIE